MERYLQIHETDNVAVAIDVLSPGECLEFGGKKVAAAEEIPAGHKIALADIREGGTIVKYGMPIGAASKNIKKGQWIHTHNMKTGLSDVIEYSYTPKAVEVKGQKRNACFQGFRRNNGRVGIRNEIWILPTVGCVNNVATALAGRAKSLICGSITDVAAFPHPYGCSQMGEDQENTRKILAALMDHPNAGGVLVLGLGCENSGVEELKQYSRQAADPRISYLVCQECEDEMKEGLKRIAMLIDQAKDDRREEIGAEELVVGLKCGGSDGFSGITANPLVGAYSDLLIDCGGSTILTEVPEMFGAETLLMNRCETEEVFRDTVTLINDFKQYFITHGQQIYENPSPGNKKGGISTLEEKSLGCTQKSGSAKVVDVLSYGARIRKRGLSLLSAPGNDLVAATALAAAGAHMVLFTTGRGTPFAAPVPTLKIATNHLLGDRKRNWIDFDAGAILDGKPIKELAEDFFSYVLEVAGGTQVKAEEAGFHDMAIFKQGVTL